MSRSSLAFTHRSAPHLDVADRWRNAVLCQDRDHVRSTCGNSLGVLLLLQQTMFRQGAKPLNATLRAEIINVVNVLNKTQGGTHTRFNEQLAGCSRTTAVAIVQRGPARSKYWSTPLCNLARVGLPSLYHRRCQLLPSTLGR